MSGTDSLIPPDPDKPADKAPSSKRSTTRAGRRAESAKKSAAKPKDKAPSGSSTPRPRKATLETRLAGSLTTVGLSVSMAGAAMKSPAVQLDGVSVIEHTPNIAKALDDLAKNDPRVAKALERALTVGAYGGLITALSPLVLAIAGNHGLIPANMVEQMARMAGEQPAEPAAGGATAGTPWGAGQPPGPVGVV